jgi:hypothetical protein
VSRFAIVTVLLLIGAASCGPPSVRPVSYADPEIPCPGGHLVWDLSIVDQRASREGGDKTISAVRDGIQKSFPGCRWAAPGESGTPTIAIEIHRFASIFDGGSWEAAVEWTVSARDAGGRRVTEFEANEEVSRPNYRGTDNEKESLSEAFRRALERTVKGLAGMSRFGALRPREGTPGGEATLPFFEAHPI